MYFLIFNNDFLSVNFYNIGLFTWKFRLSWVMPSLNGCMSPYRLDLFPNKNHSHFSVNALVFIFSWVHEKKKRSK